MNVPSLQKPVSGADVPLERLAGNSSLSEQQKVGEAARQFESLLLRKILAESQKTVIHSKLTEDSTASGIYRDMVTNQLADSISKSGALGLAQTLKLQLGHEAHLTPAAGQDGSTAASGARPPHFDHPVARVVRAAQPVLQNINEAQ